MFRSFKEVVVSQTASVTDAGSGTNIDVTGCTIQLPAGTYYVAGRCTYTNNAGAVATTFGFGVTFTGTVGTIRGIYRAGANTSSSQSNNTTLGSFSIPQSTRPTVDYLGRITVTTSGVLRLQFNISAGTPNSITLTGGMLIVERAT